MPVKKPVEWGGTVYASGADLARAAGVSRATVSLAIKRGTLATLGVGSAAAVAMMQQARKQPVVSMGHSWPSQADCAAALGVTASTLCGALQRGTLDRLVQRRIGVLA